MATYRVTRKLGTSALLESYVGVSASEPELRPVWVKRLVSPWSKDAAFLKRFQPMATQWRGAPAATLPGLVEFGSGADQLWVVQSLTDGESLRSVLSGCAAQKTKPAMNEVAAVALRAAAALASLHEASAPLSHGDVCASTLHLTVDGHLLLSDFGVALAAGDHSASGAARSEQSVQAPEQAVGTADPPADVYRLAQVMLELLTGATTMPAGGLPGVPQGLSGLLSWMLTANPNRRPQAREVETALQLEASTRDWSVSDDDVARFIRRALPQRGPLTAVPTTGGTVLNLTPTAFPDAPAPIAPVVLGRMAPRRMSAENLAAVKAAEAEVAKIPAEAWRDTRVADALVTKKKLNPDHRRQAVANAQLLQIPVNDSLVAMGYVDEDEVVATFAELTNTRPMSSDDLAKVPPQRAALELLPERKAMAMLVAPLSLKNDTELSVAMPEPLDPTALEQLKRLTNRTTIVAFRAGPRALQRTISRLYQGMGAKGGAQRSR